ncbi:MAG: hypothetical protein Q9218_003125 [Villophora microphyllina]
MDSYRLHSHYRSTSRERQRWKERCRRDEIMDPSAISTATNVAISVVIIRKSIRSGQEWIESVRDDQPLLDVNFPTETYMDMTRDLCRGHFKSQSHLPIMQTGKPLQSMRKIMAPTISMTISTRRAPPVNFQLTPTAPHLQDLSTDINSVMNAFTIRLGPLDNTHHLHPAAYDEHQASMARQYRVLREQEEAVGARKAALYIETNEDLAVHYQEEVERLKREEFGCEYSEGVTGAVLGRRGDG